MGNRAASYRCFFDKDGPIILIEVAQPIWLLYILPSKLYSIFPDERHSTALISCLRTSVIAISRSESISNIIYKMQARM
jgi:hypothetical protein